MDNTSNNSENNIPSEEEQRDIIQSALGNPTRSGEENSVDEELSTKPKTSGTGSNPSGARKDSLIVHPQKDGEERYEANPSDPDTRQT